MVKDHRPHRHHCPNWRKYTSRRIVIVTVAAACGYALSYFLHSHVAGKSGELLFGAVLGHCLLEVEA